MNSDSNNTRKKLEDYSYNLNNHIGKGYSSHVYKGKNDLTNQTVAIKVIDMKMIKGEVHKNLLASEIEVLKTLKNSENIIQLFDIYTTKNNTYIITQLCDEGDLSKLINNKKNIPESQAIELMSQIINGYNEISKKGIIHRDLKPANIFLRHHEIKIADFGFAMKNSDSKKYSSYNVGSPIYMPPEALNENKYSFKSDIWALGVIYYEMLTGKTPWRAKTEKQLGRQLLSVPIQRLMPKNICPASIDFLKRTLTININERMSPQDLNLFTFSVDKLDRQSTKGDLISQKSIPDARAFLFGSKNNETSLNKNTVTIPKNIDRFNFLKNNIEGPASTKQNKKPMTVKKTLQHSKKKTQFIQSQISPSSNQLNTLMKFNSTKKQSQNFKSEKNITIIDKKMLSKHLLSQIHFCRFIYKLLMRVEDKLSEQFNTQIDEMKRLMSGLLFQRLTDIEQLSFFSKIEKKQYQESADYPKIVQIVGQYQTKYKKDLNKIYHHSVINNEKLKSSLNQQIVFLHSLIDGRDCFEVKEEVIALDYLITLRQLLILLEENNIQNFHNRAKMQQIVDGSPSQNITSEHISAITQKLKTLKML